MLDARRVAPAVARNRDAILAILEKRLPERGLVLEVASGTGEHVVHFAASLGQDLLFQPSDPQPEARGSIDAWRLAAGVTNVLPAIALDAAATEWPINHADAVLCINMIHISPWRATEGLMRGAARILQTGGLLYLYGPYRRDGRHTAPSNASFDADLRRQNPEWGVRDIEAVIELAGSNGFAMPEVEEMPANNLSLCFRRRSAGS